MNATKIFAMFAVLVLVAAPVFAKNDKETVVETEEDNTSNDLHALCQAKGFDFGIARWEYKKNDGGWQVKVGDGTTTSVTGNEESASWTSNPDADGVLTNGSNDIFAADDSATKGVDHNGNINNVTFCGYNDEVPEFGVIAATVAIAGSMVGLVALRK